MCISTLSYISAVVTFKMSPAQLFLGGWPCLGISDLLDEVENFVQTVCAYAGGTLLFPLGLDKKDVPNCDYKKINMSTAVSPWATSASLSE